VTNGGGLFLVIKALGGGPGSVIVPDFRDASLTQ
jgi:hypothetical protein